MLLSSGSSVLATCTAEDQMAEAPMLLFCPDHLNSRRPNGRGSYVVVLP